MCTRLLYTGSRSSISPNLLGTTLSTSATTRDRSTLGGMSSVDVGRVGTVSVSAIIAGEGASTSSLASQAREASAVVTKTVEPRKRNAGGTRLVILPRRGFINSKTPALEYFRSPGKF